MIPSIVQQITGLQGSMHAPKRGLAEEQEDLVLQAITNGHRSVTALRYITTLTPSQISHATGSLLAKGLIDFDWRGKAKLWRLA